MSLAYVDANWRIMAIALQGAAMALSIIIYKRMLRGVDGDGLKCRDAANIA